MVTAQIWWFFAITARIHSAIVITDCNFVLNRVTTQATCHCESDECIFNFDLNDINTIEETSFITCDHTSAKLEQPDISTQCIINCNAPNSCNDFMVNVFDGDEISITCDGINSCNLLEITLDDADDSLSANDSISDIICSGAQSCHSLQYHCGGQTECNLECNAVNTCTDALMDCSVGGGHCECVDFCNSTAIITPSPTFIPTILFTQQPSASSTSTPSVAPTTPMPTVSTTSFFTTNPVSPATESSETRKPNQITETQETETTQFYPVSTITAMETTTAATDDTVAVPQRPHIQSGSVLAVKLKSQEVGDAYFHCLFTVLYALYIGFALFHMVSFKFKLFVPCSVPQFHSKRMSVIIAYILLISTAIFGFIFNLYLYESPIIDDPLIFCYFMSFSLFCSHTLLAIWLFHSWIYFDFSTVLSRKSLQKIFRVVRSIVFVMIVIMLILHIVQHSESIPIPVAEVTFGFLSFMSSFVLFGWTLISLIKMETRNKVRLAGNNGDGIERNGCFTWSGLLTKFLWIGFIVSVLWILQCIFTFSKRLWSNGVIDANDINNKRNDHQITVIVLYFVIDLIALILLLSLYYILANELANLCDDDEPLKQSRKRIKIPIRYEKGKVNDDDDEVEDDDDDDDDDGDEYVEDSNEIQIYHKNFNEHSGIDGDNEDDTETIIMSNLL